MLGATSNLKGKSNHGSRTGSSGHHRKHGKVEYMGRGVGVPGTSSPLTWSLPQSYDPTSSSFAIWGEDDDSEEELSEASLSDDSEKNLDTFALSSDEDNATFQTPRHWMEEVANSKRPKGSIISPIASAVPSLSTYASPGHHVSGSSIFTMSSSPPAGSSPPKSHASSSSSSSSSSSGSFILASQSEAEPGQALESPSLAAVIAKRATSPGIPSVGASSMPNLSLGGGGSGGSSISVSSGGGSSISFGGAVPQPSDYYVQSINCLLEQFAILQKEMTALRIETRRGSTFSHPAKKDMEIRALNFRITELQSEVNQLVHENTILKQRNSELERTIISRPPNSPSSSSSSSSSGSGSSKSEATKEALRQEIRRLKHMNEDYVKNERAVSKILAELGLWKERCKVLESQLRKRPPNF